MEQRKFGDILREERKRKGLSLVQTAERLRIRPDILQTIENSDIPNMPPRGYARNMVMGYAKFVGLDPAELGAMYNEAFAGYEAAMGRTQAMPAYRDHERTAIREPRAARRAREAREGHAPAAAGYGADRTQRMPVVSDDSDVISSRSSFNADRDYDRADRELQHNDGFDEADDFQYYEEANANPLQGAADAVSGFFSRFKRGDDGIYAGGTSPTRNPALLAGIAAALVVIIVLVLVLGRGCSKAEEPASVSASQQTGTAQTETPAAPTSFKFEYKVDSGSEAWIEVYVDGQQQVAEQVTGEQSGTFDVTGEIEFVCATTEGVHVYVDGTEQELKTNENGLVDLTYKFSDILDKWNKEHGVSSSSSSSSNTSSSTGSSTDSSSSSSNSSSASDSSTGSTDASASTATQDTSQSADTGQTYSSYTDTSAQTQDYNSYNGYDSTGSYSTDQGSAEGTATTGGY